MSNTSVATNDGGFRFLGMPFNRKMVTGQKQVSWSAIFILSLVWFTWGFHIFAGGLALTFTISRYTNDPRVIAFVQNLNVIIMLGPFISYISDQIWSRLGRRRPFLIIAWAASTVAMFAFAFLPQIAGSLNAVLGLVGIPPVSEFMLLILIIVGYTTLYDLQAPMEPLFLECVPPHQRGRFFAIRGILFKLAVLIFFQVLWASYDETMDMLGWLGFGNILFLSGEQCIYIIAGALFAITGAYLLFNIEETKDPTAPNKKFTELFTGIKNDETPVVARTIDSTHPGTLAWFVVATLLLVGYVLDIAWNSFNGPGLFWIITHIVLLIPAIHAIMAFVGRKTSAPTAAIILAGSRVLANIVLLAVNLLFFPKEPVDIIVRYLIASLIIASVGIPYFLRSRRVRKIFKVDVMGALYRIPIVAFFVTYIKDVFFTWSNYPFYIVLVIPGIEQSVWGNFGNLMQTKQFNYSMANQALWGLPVTLIAMVILTPFSGWYSDSKKRIPHWLRHTALVAGVGLLYAGFQMYKTYGPADIRELPSWPAMFGIAIVTAIGCLSTIVWLIETLLNRVGREHSRAWASLMAVFLSLGVNILLFTLLRLSPDRTIPITLFMMINVASGSFGALLETFIGPMIYEYMPRSRMGTINSGRGLMGDGLRWMVNNLGGWWIWWFSLRTLYPGQKNVSAETMKYDYTSMYILMFILFIPVIWCQVWFIKQIMAKKILRWGVLEVEGDDLPPEQQVAAASGLGPSHD